MCKKITYNMCKKPEFNLNIKLSKQQLKVVLDAIGYAEWQFSDGNGDYDPEQIDHDTNLNSDKPLTYNYSIKLLHKICRKIEKAIGFGSQYPGWK